MLDIKEEDFMKKSIAMLLAVAMTVSLAGCGGGQAETAGSAAEQTTAVEAAARKCRDRGGRSRGRSIC